MRLNAFYQVWRESKRDEICKKSMSLVKIPQFRNIYKLGKKLNDSCRLMFPDKAKMNVVLKIKYNTLLLPQ